MRKSPNRNELLDLMAEELHVAREEIVPEARFSEDLDVDSLMAAELMMRLEDHLGIEIPSDPERFQTVGSVLDFVIGAVETQVRNPELESSGSPI